MPATSTFAQRFAFARLHQAYHGVAEGDEKFADAIGVSAGSVTGYKSREEAPPVDRVIAIAERCGVDPGWLAFGERSAAPAPSGFAVWLANRTTQLSPEAKVVDPFGDGSDMGVPVLPPIVDDETQDERERPPGKRRGRGR